MQLKYTMAQAGKSAENASNFPGQLTANGQLSRGKRMKTGNW